MVNNQFDALLTFDKNLQHQQNFDKYTLTVFALSASINTYTELTKLSSKIEAYLDNGSLPPGVIAISI